MDRKTTREFVTEIFVEMALVLGGIAAVCPLDDAVVWRLVNAFHALHGRILERIAEDEAAGAPPRSPVARVEPHPAIEQFLRAIRRESSRAKAR